MHQRRCTNRPSKIWAEHQRLSPQITAKGSSPTRGLNAVCRSEETWNPCHRRPEIDWTAPDGRRGLDSFQSQGLELMRRRLGATTGAEAAEKLIAQYKWSHLVVLSGEAGVTSILPKKKPYMLHVAWSICGR